MGPDLEDKITGLERRLAVCESFYQLAVKERNYERLQVDDLRRQLKAENDRVQRNVWLERSLQRAYTEMVKQRPALTAVFDREVWDEADKFIEAFGPYVRPDDRE